MLGFSNYIALVNRNWIEIWPDRNFKWQILIIPVYFLGFALFFPWFFDFIESRDGIKLGDFLLDFLPSKNVSLLLFFCLYPAIFVSLVYLIAHPRLLLIALETYCLATTLRIVSITVFPLHPPEGYIALQEPVAQLFANDHRIISKDLFFSGHMVTILSLYFPLRNLIIRRLVSYLAIAVAFLVLIQHVHYTVDVVAALFVSYACYRISLKLTANIKPDPIYRKSVLL